MQGAVAAPLAILTRWERNNQPVKRSRDLMQILALPGSDPGITKGLFLAGLTSDWMRGFHDVFGRVSLPEVVNLDRNGGRASLAGFIRRIAGHNPTRRPYWRHQMTEFSEIPVIDIAPLIEGADTSRLAQDFVLPFPYFPSPPHLKHLAF